MPPPRRQPLLATSRLQSASTTLCIHLDRRKEEKDKHRTE